MAIFAMADHENQNDICSENHDGTVAEDLFRKRTLICMCIPMLGLLTRDAQAAPRGW